MKPLTKEDIQYLGSLDYGIPTHKVLSAVKLRKEKINKEFKEMINKADECEKELIKLTLITLKRRINQIDDECFPIEKVQEK